VKSLYAHLINPIVLVNVIGIFEDNLTSTDINELSKYGTLLIPLLEVVNKVSFKSIELS
jgi:hypothetical protein